jgi:hypothetical protein
MTTPLSDPTALKELLQTTLCSLPNSGLRQFWLDKEPTPDPQTSDTNTEQHFLTSQVSRPIFYSSDNPVSLPLSACELSEIDHSEIYLEELCHAFGDEQIITSSLSQYIHHATLEQGDSSLWKDLRNGRITSSIFASVTNRRDGTDPTSLITQIMGYKPLVHVPKQIQWGRDHESIARTAYIEVMQRNKAAQVQVKPSGLTLLPAHSFLGASGDGWIFIDERSPGVLEIKCPYSVDGNIITDRSPEDIAEAYSSFF